MGRKQTFNIGYAILALVLLGLFQMWLASRDVPQLSHTELTRMVDKGRIASVTITETTVQGEFKEPQERKALFISARGDPNAAESIENAGVAVTGGTDSNWLTVILSWVVLDC